MPARLLTRISLLAAVLWSTCGLAAEPLSPVIQPDPPGTIVEDDPPGPVLEEQPLAPVAEPMAVYGGEGCYDACACEPGCPCPLHGIPGCRPLARRVFADYLYLRPGNDRVPFAVLGNPATFLPVGRETEADVGFQGGFRAGWSRRFTPYVDLTATYTHFDGSDPVSVSAPAGNHVLWSLVTHPAGPAAQANFLDATADLEIRFRTVDVDFRRIVFYDRQGTVRWLAGIRYAHLEQEFQSSFSNANLTDIVNTKIGFDGGGLRLGVEGERRNLAGWFIYGRGTASFVGGRFQSDYLQSSNNARIVETGGAEDRILSILDLEMGIGWTGPGDRLRFLAGYMVSAWYNSLRTAEFIRSVQANNTIDAREALTFDGMFVRAELRY